MVQLLIRWDHVEAEAILGGRAFYFTIMRDPVDLFASAWDYYGLEKTYKMSLEKFARRDTSGFREIRFAEDERLHMVEIQMLLQRGSRLRESCKFTQLIAHIISTH